MEAIALVVDEILTVKLNSDLAFSLNISISILFLVQAPTFEKTLLKYRRRITLDMKSVAVLILEILTRELKSNLAFFLSLSISKAFAVQTPDFEKMFVN